MILLLVIHFVVVFSACSFAGVVIFPVVVINFWCCDLLCFCDVVAILVLLSLAVLLSFLFQMLAFCCCCQLAVAVILLLVIHFVVVFCWCCLCFQGPGTGLPHRPPHGPRSKRGRATLNSH